MKCLFAAIIIFVNSPFSINCKSLFYVTGQWFSCKKIVPTGQCPIKCSVGPNIFTFKSLWILSIIVSIIVVETVTSTRKLPGPNVTVRVTVEPLKQLGFGWSPIIWILYILGSISVVILLHA